MKDRLQFSTDWTTNNTGNWMNAIGHLAGRPGVQGLEIGTWEGRSTAWFLEHIVTGDGAKITTVDRNHKRFENNRQILDDVYGAHLVSLERDATEFLLREAFHGNQYDFIYMDAAKDSALLIEHAGLAWKILKKGGVLIFDDYQWPGNNPSLEGNSPRHFSNPPRIAIDAFLTCKYLEHDLLHKAWQAIVRKK